MSEIIDEIVYELSDFFYETKTDIREAVIEMLYEYDEYSLELEDIITDMIWDIQCTRENY